MLHIVSKLCHERDAFFGEGSGRQHLSLPRQGVLLSVKAVKDLPSM